MIENRARRRLGLPLLGVRESVTHGVALAGGISPVGSVSVVKLGPAIEHDVALPIAPVRRYGSSHVSGGGSVRSRGFKVERGAARRDRAEETMWLATTAMLGGWVAEQLVPTREAAALGAVVGLVWGARTWRDWQGL